MQQRYPTIWIAALSATLGMGALAVPLAAAADTTAPKVSITAPANGATVNGIITIAATATDNVGVTKVKFFVDGVLLGSDTTKPYTWAWNTAAASVGTHTLQAKAFDAAGNRGKSAIVTVTVSRGDTTAPKVSITAPANGATVNGIITIAATATDNVGVTKVAFYVDGVLKSTDTTDPYGFSWDTTTAVNGSRTLTAKAYDAAGNSASASVTVAVNNGDTTPPTVQITAPANNATVIGTVDIAATATDNVGVTKVDFYVDNVLKSTDTTNPYGYSWDTTTIVQGSHTLKATASDAAGNTAYSIITVTVASQDLTAPTVQLTAPANNATVIGNISINATASDNIGVTRVEFFVDDTLITTDYLSPYGITWNSASVVNGAHALKAKAYDAAGNNAQASVSVTVNNLDTTAPTVAMTAPANGATVSGTVTLSATAADDIGVSYVAFYVDGAFLALDTTSPYSADWNTATAANGAHVLTAVAFDAANNHTTSAPVNVTVNNAGDTVPPSVQVTAPANGATVSGQISINATATDNVGVIRVAFNVDGLAKDPADTTAPYAYVWDTTTVTNGAHTLTATAYDAAGNSATSAPVAVTVDNHPNDTTPPVVNLTAPANNATVSGTVTITATATDNVGVTHVDFYADGNLVTTDMISPYSAAWNSTAVPNGLHSLSARAYDAANNSSLSPAVLVTVNNQTGDTTPPVVSITSPPDATTVSGTVSVTATATDNIGVTQVEFYVDGVLKSTDTTSPYDFNWDTTAVAAGGHTLTAKAYDAANNIGNSTPITVLVQQPSDTTPPTVTLTAPVNGSTVSGSVNVTATATDNVGVTRVEFYVDGALNNTDTTNPYSFAWDTTTAANGSHTLTAKAFDAAGNNATSSPVAVTVNNSDTTPPTVSVTSPSDGATVSGVVNVAATATDNISVARVEFYVDSVLKATDTTSPYSFSWDTTTASNSAHTLVAKAYDAANNNAQASISVVVNNDTTPPTATITSPATGTTVSGTVTITATANDNVGVTRVDFLVDGALLSSDTTSPYNANWNTTTATNGSHSLTAQAFDAAGNSGMSTANVVTVSNGGDATAPTVSVTSPSDGSTVQGTITVTATANDNVGVARVEFDVLGNDNTWQLFGTDTTSPYSAALDTTTILDGDSALRARAFDAAGNMGTSNIIFITVANGGGDTIPPTVNIVSPANGATVSGTITISATATDNNEMNSVSFYLDNNTLLGVVAFEPYTVQWDSRTTTNGAHLITAVADDISSNTAEKSVAITVSN